MPVDVSQLKTVNEVIRDRIIRHAVLMEGFKTGEVRKIISFFNRSLEPDLLRQLTRYAGKTLTENRLRIMRESTKEVLAAAYLRMRKELEPDLIDLGKSQGKWDAAVIEKSLPVKIALTRCRCRRSRRWSSTGRWTAGWFGSGSKSLGRPRRSRSTGRS